MVNLVCGLQVRLDSLNNAVVDNSACSRIANDFLLFSFPNYFVEGNVSKAAYASFPALPNGFKLFDCDNTMLDQVSWSNDYTISKTGNVISVGLGAGGTVQFTVDPTTNLPTSVSYL